MKKMDPFWRTIGLGCASIATMSGVISFIAGAASMIVTGGRSTPHILLIWCMTIPFFLVNLFMLHHFGLGDALRSLRTSFADDISARRTRRAERAHERTPLGTAWSDILHPPHLGSTDATIVRRMDLHARTTAMTGLLAGSLDPTDISATVLLEKTVAELGASYADALSRRPSREEVERLDRTLDETLETMVAAAETRRTAALAASTGRFDDGVRHAAAAAARVAGTPEPESPWA